MQKISVDLKINFIFFLQNEIDLLILLLLLLPFDLAIKYKPDLVLPSSWDELINQSISDFISLPNSFSFIVRAESCLSVCVCLQCVFLSISTVFLGICGIWFPSACVKGKLSSFHPQGCERVFTCQKRFSRRRRKYSCLHPKYPAESGLMNAACWATSS